MRNCVRTRRILLEHIHVLRKGKLTVSWKTKITIDMFFPSLFVPSSGTSRLLLCLLFLFLNSTSVKCFWADSFISQLCFFYFEDLKIECLQESQELNLQKLRNSELILTEAKQKMRELTINIKMKEDLIKELIKTGNSI